MSVTNPNIWTVVRCDEEEDARRVFLAAGEKRLRDWVLAWPWTWEVWRHWFVTMGWWLYAVYWEEKLVGFWAATFFEREEGGEAALFHFGCWGDFPRVGFVRLTARAAREQVEDLAKENCGVECYGATEAGRVVARLAGIPLIEV